MLTPADAEYLRGLPERLAAISGHNSGAGAAIARSVERRARLQRAGLITVRQVGGDNDFLVMITDAGAAALKAAS